MTKQETFNAAKAKLKRGLWIVRLSYFASIGVLLCLAYGGWLAALGCAVVGLIQYVVGDEFVQEALLELDELSDLE